jgi:formamidopyrimidine-DNA glycosylase
MTKKPERSELEYLRAENRRLNKQVNELKKNINRATKLSNRFVQEVEEQLDDTITHEQVWTKKNNCPNCNGELIMSDLGIRSLYICKDCPYRVSKIKK